ncbi:MAG: pseudaminic acid synthase [Pseudomonadota bacterium]
MTSSISIAGRKIGQAFPPYCIAEISANHGGQLSRVFELIDQAVRVGADAVKIQTYRPDTITLDADGPDFQIKGGLWDGRSLYELYEEAHTPWDWHKPIFEHAAKSGIALFSSPFDTTAIDLLEELGAPAYKIASFEAVDLPLIRYAASTAKPLIISTGMADSDEISEAIEAAREGGCTQLAILHCVSGYPAKASDYNLATLSDMQSRFSLVTGLSDHTLSNATAVASVALGASIIEKHFTMDRTAGGPDDSFSLEPDDFEALCTDARCAWEALGKVDYGLKSSEQGNAQFRRSLYFVRDLEKGALVQREDIRSVRPGYGLAPKFFDNVLGKRLAKSVMANTAVSWDVLEA